MALSAVAQRSTVRPTAASRRSAVVVKAESGRRAVLGGLLSAAALTVSGKAMAAATPVDIFDDRKVLETGYDLIYEARDLDLTQAQRDGMTQSRANLEATKKNVKESERRILSNLEPLIKKNYWTEAKEELRRQAGTLRFDLNALAATKPKAERKNILALNKEFLSNVEAMDFAIRQKDEAAASAKLVAVKSSLTAVMAAVL